MKVSHEDSELIMAICQRAWDMDEPDDRILSMMDIQACHANGQKLDLKKFLEFPDFDFAHDWFGIRRHIDRNTGILTECFLPRCLAI